METQEGPLDRLLCCSERCQRGNSGMVPCHSQGGRAVRHGGEANPYQRGKGNSFSNLPMTGKSRRAVKTICWEQRHRPWGIPKSKTSAQESLLALRSVFQTPLLRLAWGPKHWTPDSDTLARVEREGLRDSNNEDIRQLGTPLCTNTHISEKLHLQLSDALKKALEGSRFF